MTLFTCLAACALTIAGPSQQPARPAQPQAGAPPPGRVLTPPGPARGVSREGEAYYQFMVGRFLESEGDLGGAITAFTEAARLDPGSAEILAELASLYAREDKFQEALKHAEAALKNDRDNVTANRVLGVLYGSLARADEGTAPLSAEAAGFAAKAAGHFEAARRASGTSDLGLDMMLAQIYLRTGAAEKAIAVLTQLTAEEGGRPEPISLLLQAYDRVGRPADAIKLLETVAPGQPQFYARLGELYSRQQQWPEAVSAYERAVVRSPRNADLRTRLAVALLSGGGEPEAGRAVDVLRQLRRDEPADARVLYLLAQAERKAGQIDESEATARELITIAPGSLTGPYALALALEEKQQYRQVVETLTPAVAAAPSATAGMEATPLLVLLGFAHVELGEIDRAIAAFERAREASPQNPTIDMYVLQARISARQFDAAIALARKLRAERPSEPQLLRLEADALRRSGRAQEGAALLATALEANPADLGAHLALAEYRAQTSAFDEALRVLERAATRFPGSLDVAFEQGAVLERQERWGDAERKFKDVIARDPLHAQALNYLGYMLADRGERLDEAVGYIKRALAIEPYNGAYLDSLGWAYFRQNRLDLAEPPLRKAAGQRVRDSAVQDHLGDLLLRLGRHEEAIQAWQRALAGDGEQVDRAAIDRKIRSAREKAPRR